MCEHSGNNATVTCEKTKHLYRYNTGRVREDQTQWKDGEFGAARQEV